MRYWMLLFFGLQAHTTFAWGFLAHREINRHAVFTLPPAMFSFYKQHLGYITENAVNPDKRRYVVEGEAPKHYIDMEYYADEAHVQDIPRSWDQAKAQYTEDMRAEHGILPWHILHVKQALTRAFRDQDLRRILQLSADIGHYLADANVPLHTSQNYDGQLTGQEGIHGLWETRLPELFLSTYNLFTGQASYVSHPQQAIWAAIIEAHQGVKYALDLEKQLSQRFPQMRKYSFEQKGTTLRKVYSVAYAQAYHQLLSGQVEQQMRASIKMVVDFWFTCWVDAGRPPLDKWLQQPVPEEPEPLPQNQPFSVRVCGD
ncbi:MAG: zinc dependent phospholipase C family protein [Bacteroidota bacterium]